MRWAATGLTILGLVTFAASAAATSMNGGDRKLAHRLTLHLADMPTGWRVETPTNSASCKPTSALKSLETARAQTEFSRMPDYAGSTVGVFATVPVSQHAYTTYSNSFAKCVAKLPGMSKVTVGAMSFPRFGNQSRAWNIRGSVSNTSIYFDVILVRIRRADVIYLFGGVGSGDSNLEIKAVHRATARA